MKVQYIHVTCGTNLNPVTIYRDNPNDLKVTQKPDGIVRWVDNGRPVMFVCRTCPPELQGGKVKVVDQ